MSDENISSNSGAVMCFRPLSLSGCTRIARSLYLSSYDRDIRSATRAIESTRDNARRALAYAKRGSAYSEKARYSKAFKLISADGCSCDPYNPLLALYEGGRQYDQAWELFYRARKSKKWIALESLDRLKKESGRSN